MKLLLLRHGETEWTERGLLHGRLDAPLSARGRQHAESAARRLGGQRFDALYASPQGRAMQTASILSEAVGIAPTPLDPLREMNYGVTEGWPLSIVDPDGTGAFLLRPFIRAAMALTGEHPNQLATRVAAGMQMIQERHPDGRLIVVTHWGVLSMIMAHLLNGDPARWRDYGPWTACGITELRTANGGWEIVRMNDGEHLS